MDRGLGVRQEFPEGVKTHAAVSEVCDILGIHVVLAGPAGPDAGDGGGGINKDAIHVDEQAFTGDLGRRTADSHEVPSQKLVYNALMKKRTNRRLSHAYSARSIVQVKNSVCLSPCLKWDA